MVKRLLLVACVVGCGACGGEASGPSKIPNVGDPGGTNLPADSNEPGDPNGAGDHHVPSDPGNPGDPGHASDPGGADTAEPGDTTPVGDPTEPLQGIEINQGWLGGACTDVSDCDNSAIGASKQCLTAGFPNGFCTQSCTQSQSNPNRFLCPDPPGGYDGTLNTWSRCVDANGVALCATECDIDKSPTGCRPGYDCVLRQRYNEPTLIYPICLPSPAQRWPGEDAPAFDIGDACLNDIACEHLECLAETGGYCTKTMCDVAGCPSGSHCFEEPADSGTFVCLKDCTDGGDCRGGDGYSCDSTENICWVP